MTTSPTTPHSLVPATVRYAGFLAMAQSAAGLGYAAFLLVREVTGHGADGVVRDGGGSAGMVGLGTAVFFVIIFGAVFAGAVNMNRGRRWGRGPVAMLEMFSLVMAYYLWSADQVVWAIVVGLTGIAGLAMLFNPAALQWATAAHEK